jgi:uncharacterized protein YcbX
VKVLEIWRHPVKSVGGEQLGAATLTELGIEHDRGWGIVDDATGNVLTARREPQLLMATASIVDGRPLITTDAGTLRTSADLSRWLGRPVTLTAAGDDGGTYENPRDPYAETDWVSWQGPGGAWHDSAKSRVSIVSTGSLGGWDVRRFRTNIVVDGDSEDAWVGQTVRLGEATLDVQKRISRCVMVTRPQPGLDRDLDLLRTINGERAACLSVGALVTSGATIRVGDEIALA